MANKKILVNVWENLIEGLKRHTTRACLKRDPYLDRILRHEAQRLDAEIPEANSDKARAYIARELDELPDRKPVNLQLSEETVELINDVCSRKNIPRDAFIHRVLLLLLMRPKVVEKLIPVDWQRARDLLLEQGQDQLYRLLAPSTLLTLGDIIEDDPFWYARECLSLLRQEDADTPTLHGAYINRLQLSPAIPNAIGFNCYLPDKLVEGTPENIQRQREVDELLSALGEGL